MNKNSIQGKAYENLFFRNYTKKDVEYIFDKAHNLSKKCIENNISMIFLDKMGLAEHSLNNPLKIILS